MQHCSGSPYGAHSLHCGTPCIEQTSLPWGVYIVNGTFSFSLPLSNNITLKTSKVTVSVDLVWRLRTTFPPSATVFYIWMAEKNPKCMKCPIFHLHACFPYTFSVHNHNNHSLATPSMKSSMISRRHSIKIPIETFFDLVTLTFEL